MKESPIRGPPEVARAIAYFRDSFRTIHHKGSFRAQRREDSPSCVRYPVSESGDQTGGMHSRRVAYGKMAYLVASETKRIRE